MNNKKLSLYIFGTGLSTSSLYPALRLDMCDILAFVDERPHTWNTQYMAHPVIGVKDMYIEQYDLLFIMCHGAKDVAKRLVKDYAIPQERIVLFDFFEKKSIKYTEENAQESPQDTLKRHLSPFQGLLEIIDVDILINAPLAKSWLVPKKGKSSKSSTKTKYCKFMLEFLNFESSSIQPCCGVESLHLPSEFTHTGGNLNIASYRKYINKCITELQTDTYLCDGCSSLIEIDKSLSDILNEDFNFKTIIFNSHRLFCNCKCIYCTFWQQVPQSMGKKAPYAMFEITKQLVQDGLVNKKCKFRWAGGEPTILKEFETSAKWLMEQGYFQTILTNALQISPAIITMLESEKCDLLISIDAGSRAQYKTIKGIDAFDKVKKICATYSKHSAKKELMVLKYIIFDVTNDISEIRRFFDFCMEIGVNHVAYSLDFVEIQTRSVSDQTLKSAAFFVYQAKKMGLHCQPFSIEELYASQINKLISDV